MRNQQPFDEASYNHLLGELTQMGGFYKFTNPFSYFNSDSLM